MNNRAQFFLIATLVIVLVMISLATLTTLARSPPEDQAVFDLSKEIAYEGTQLLDYGTFNTLTGAALQNHLLKLSDHYASLHRESNFFIAYGDESNMNILQYEQKPIGTVSINTGSGGNTGFDLTQPTANIISNIEQNSKHIKVLLPNQKTIEFDLNPGQNFFLVVEKSEEEQRIVSTAGSGPVNISRPFRSIAPQGAS